MDGRKRRFDGIRSLPPKLTENRRQCWRKNKLSSRRVTYTPVVVIVIVLIDIIVVVVVVVIRHRRRRRHDAERKWRDVATLSGSDATWRQSEVTWRKYVGAAHRLSLFNARDLRLIFRGFSSSFFVFVDYFILRPIRYIIGMRAKGEFYRLCNT